MEPSRMSVRGYCEDGTFERARCTVDDFGSGSWMTCGSCMSTAGGAFRQEVQVNLLAESVQIDFLEPTLSCRRPLVL